MEQNELKEFLDFKASFYESPKFIEHDPIQIPHRYIQKEDIEISAFLIAMLAWGNRKSIINSGNKLMTIMGESPYDFVMSHSDEQLETLSLFVHRTFNGTDFVGFINGLQHIYKNHNGLEAVFSKPSPSLQHAIAAFKTLFFEIPHATRTEKHISDPLHGSAAKRINMYLRWMVRKDTKGVDLGIWKNIDASQLSCPLDVHSGNVARKLGLLHRTQNDAKAVLELDRELRLLDAKDPVKYDFALFGLGVFEGF